MRQRSRLRHNAEASSRGLVGAFASVVSSMLNFVSSARGKFRNLSLTSRSTNSNMTICNAIDRQDMKVAEVVVVGSGLAGLSATLTLLQHDVPVVLIEADAALGGNSCKASSGMNSMTSQMDDSIQEFANDIVSSGGDLCDPTLVDTLVRDSEEALRFIEDMGVDMSKVSQLGGHSHARTHRNPSGPNVGFAMMKPLMEHVKSQGVKVFTSCRLVDLERCDRQYVATCEHGAPGQDWQKYEFHSRSIILAAGGFAGSPEALASAAPDLHGLPTTNKAMPAAGSVLKIAERAGAQLTQLDQVQVHPTTFIDPQEPTAHSKILAPEALRGHGAILVNGAGKRFVNELATRDVVTAAIESVHEHVYMILPQAAADVFGMPAIGFYCSKGLMTQVRSLDQLADHMSAKSQDLQATFATYNEHYSANSSQQEDSSQQDSSQQEDSFGKMVFPVPIYVGMDEPAYVAQVIPAVHYCMGGIKFTTNAEVVGKDGNVLPGVFAAGEVTGGLHGHNRLAGSSLLDCVVFGRRAGSSVAEYLMASSP